MNNETVTVETAEVKVKPVKKDRHYPVIKVADRDDGKVDVVLSDGTVESTHDSVKLAMIRAFQVKKDSAVKVKVIRTKLENVTHHRGREAMSTIQIVNEGDKFAAIAPDGTQIAVEETAKLAFAKAAEYKTANNLNAKIRRVKLTDTKTIYTGTEVTSNKVNAVLKKMNIATDVKNDGVGNFKVVAPKRMKKRDLELATTAAIAVSYVD